MRHRKRITDLSNGDAFENVPVVRVRFCTGETTSLPASELWRGRSTVTSVIETVVHVVRDGVAGALEWASYASTGEAELVSERTLRRWRDLVRDRLVGSAMTWLGPRLGLDWSTNDNEADQLTVLLDRLTFDPLIDFRATFGRSVLDTVQSPSPQPRRPTRRVRGRLDPAPPPDPPAEILPRGSSSRRGGREPPLRTHSREVRG